MRSNTPRRLDAVLVVAVVATVLAYGGFVQRIMDTGVDERAITYLVVGWIPFGVVAYAIGRRVSPPETAPSMRPIDLGAFLAIVSVLVSLGFDLLGFSPSAVPLGHALQALGVFVGIALFSWGLGRRSAVLDRLGSDHP